MGLASDLDYEVPEAGTVQRGLHAVVSSRPGAWVAARVLPGLDAWLEARTGRTLPGVLAALPILALTTTGRRTGTPRLSHLVALPHDDDLAVIGTNFGQRATPGWVYNLEAEPTATVSFKERSLEVVARPATDAERTVIFARAERVYRGYALYPQRIHGRRIRVFVLEPAA
ncbi:nitroreductase family deazaflavin-dependent oxidoreductase [Nostocoides sp. F2B08]|uniref:nitroreductase family deazaflavin-dependent oxidoreductase n=1 Tax=Nostocoides sp. F2B08 TaxID=2653936 RepID=UPI0012639FDF|nr:nitroreductase family deazaflavin-dependent oxidoreductase [Tetrasphaera sp. F2B08]KAB7744103.1 nitroreductase family deazaflavin-dependent oxidoreductase [Tetrasphaera sp. F2B08]